MLILIRFDGVLHGITVKESVCVSNWMRQSIKNMKRTFVQCWTQWAIAIMLTNCLVFNFKPQNKVYTHCWDVFLLLLLLLLLLTAYYILEKHLQCILIDPRNKMLIDLDYFSIDFNTVADRIMPHRLVLGVLPFRFDAFCFFNRPMIRWLRKRQRNVHHRCIQIQTCSIFSLCVFPIQTIWYYDLMYGMMLDWMDQAIVWILTCSFHVSRFSQSFSFSISPVSLCLFGLLFLCSIHNLRTFQW